MVAIRGKEVLLTLRSDYPIIYVYNYIQAKRISDQYMLNPYGIEDTIIIKNKNLKKDRRNRLQSLTAR